MVGNVQTLATLGGPACLRLTITIIENCGTGRTISSSSSNDSTDGYWPTGCAHHDDNDERDEQRDGRDDRDGRNGQNETNERTMSDRCTVRIAGQIAQGELFAVIFAERLVWE